MFDINVFTSTLNINECSKVYCEQDWSWDTQAVGFFHDFDLWTVLEGSGTLTCGSESYPLHAGSCFLLHPYGHYTATQDRSDPLTVIFIHFSSRFPVGAKQNFTLWRDMLHFDHFAYLLEKVVAAYTRGAGLEAACWLRVALMELFTQNCLSAQNLMQPSHCRCINRICLAIRRYPGKPHRLCVYAREYNYSGDHLGRIFKEHTGLSFTRFLTRVRLDQAKFLLRTSDLPISQIAGRLGFCDSSFFIRQYQKYESMTPSCYRRTFISNTRIIDNKTWD